MARRSRSLLKLFFMATTAALAVRLFLLEDYRIASNSMSPTLVKGDLVFILKGAFNIRLPFSTYEVFKIRRPARGEIVAFTLPERVLETFVKRVIGIEGDQIEIRQGILYVNNIPYRYSLLKNELSQEESPEGMKYPIFQNSVKIKNFGPIDVPKNHFFALGDNRLESVDSRTWGPIPYSCLKGKLGLVWFSKAIKP